MKSCFTLLWVDDDGAERFPYELDCLERIGWKAEWATSAEAAVEFLAERRYDLVLLDQVFPISLGDSYRDVWSGCRLLHWLRCAEAPVGAPQREDWHFLNNSRQPHIANAGIPVIFISAFQDDHVDEAISLIVPRSAILPKPVDDYILIEQVKKVSQQRR